MDDQQRAMEFLKSAWIEAGWTPEAAAVLASGNDTSMNVQLSAITAALRAAPEVPAARVTEPLRADESRQEQADSAIYNRGWNDCRAALLNQHGVAVVANCLEVVPPAALGAHEVHPETVDAGLDLGKSGECLLAADALEHAVSVSAECDRSATALDGFVLAPVEPTEQQIDAGIEQVQAVLDALGADASARTLALVAYDGMLAARPQGVKG